jgi:isopropylmalate/homocitrate/citramalate synthase
MTDWITINNAIIKLAKELKFMAENKTDTKKEYKKVKQHYIDDRLREEWDEQIESYDQFEYQENRERDYQSRYNDWKSDQRGW